MCWTRDRDKPESIDNTRGRARHTTLPCPCIFIRGRARHTILLCPCIVLNAKDWPTRLRTWAINIRDNTRGRARQTTLPMPVYIYTRQSQTYDITLPVYSAELTGWSKIQTLAKTSPVYKLKIQNGSSRARAQDIQYIWTRIRVSYRPCLVNNTYVELIKNNNNAWIIITHE